MSDKDTMIRSVDPGNDGVIKGSNFPTPMGMAPVIPTDSNPPSSGEPQVAAPAIPITDSAPAPQQPPQPQSDGSDVKD